VKIEHLDLLAVQFAPRGDDPTIGLDCWGMAREVARRAGLFLPTWPHFTADDPRAELTPFVEFLGDHCTAARKCGDLIIGDPKKLGWPSHVAVLVDELDLVALSTSEVHGAYAWPAFRHACDYGVWRPTRRLP
jgi:hypothetical protein